MLEAVKLYLRIYSITIVSFLIAVMFFKCRKGISLAVALLIPVIIYLTNI